MKGAIKDDRPTLAATAALDYAARGWSVIPIVPSGKRPLVAWREFQRRRASADEIAQWFDRWHGANVGIVTGRISGLVVIDVDPQHGGAESLAALQARHGALPRTVQAVTGGGGWHLYYAHPHLGAGNERLVPNRVALQPGIDLRGDGGCVVAPPSLHPSGQRYAWAPGCGPDELPLAAPPVHFFARELAPAQPGGHSPGHPIGHSREHWRHLTRDTLAPGERNSTIASLTGHLLWREVDLAVVLELMLAWNRTHCRPPLADEEVARIVHSIARVHERGETGSESPQAC